MTIHRDPFFFFFFAILPAMQLAQIHFNSNKGKTYYEAHSFHPSFLRLVISLCISPCSFCSTLSFFKGDQKKVEKVTKEKEREKRKKKKREREREGWALSFLCPSVNPRLEKHTF
ncbi:MAG: hypothetical protein JOS17DRAFT_241106 [Linnemannia elongata]|nr:MAG: hypothetical protein JOS17DRAFT_241106 [Linnemannia elongata]